MAAATKIYAGIGSRQTPITVQVTMAVKACSLARNGWLLRSGHADGADFAFESGCDSVQGRKEIWLPWKGFNGSKSELYLDAKLLMHLDDPDYTQAKAYHIASSIHPAWDRCSPAAKRLHTRNVLVILGADLNTPVDRVICWTPNGDLVGGTRTALVLAQQYGIEIINMGSPDYVEGDINATTNTTAA